MTLDNAPFVVGTVVLIVTTAILYTSLVGNVGGPQIPKFEYSWYTSTTSKERLQNVRHILREGYKKFPNGYFKTKLFPFGEVVVITDKKLLNELRNAPNESLDFTRGAAKIIQPTYTISRLLTETHHHIPTIRTTLTRNLQYLFDDMFDELKLAFADNLALSGTEWKSVTAVPTVMNIVARTSNRVIVGLPHCRNPEYCKINVTFTIDCSQTGKRINKWPEFLHPVVGPLLSKSSENQKRMRAILEPTIRYRREMLDKYGTEWADKPNDYLTWVMEEDTGPLARDTNYIVLRILQVNFAAIHTTSMSFTHALYYLALYPEYAEVLREEAIRVVKQEGWSKVAMREMKKCDSYLRESARISALSLMSLIREAQQEYTFSNGIKIRKGQYVGTTLYAIHHDESIYDDPEEFHPWRFVDADVDKDGINMKQFVATGPDFLSFGFGKHACPGRFFAANELKAMLSYVVMNYDVQFPDGSKERPANVYTGTNVVPNPTAKVMFRKRS